MTYELEFTLQRFEDRFAVLSNPTLGEIKWPIKNFPDDVKFNDPVKVRLISQKAEENEKLDTLKKALEELVN